KAKVSPSSVTSIGTKLSSVTSVSKRICRKSFTFVCDLARFNCQLSLSISKSRDNVSNSIFFSFIFSDSSLLVVPYRMLFIFIGYIMPFTTKHLKYLHSYLDNPLANHRQPTIILL